MRWALAALAAVPAAASGQAYSIVDVTAPSGPPPPAPASTPLRLGDDSTAVVSLGFAFPFYGQSFTQAYVSSNGFISFNDIGTGCCNGQPIAQAPRNGIYAYWTDLTSATGPYVQTTTVADGSKVFAARWQSYEYGTNILEDFSIQLDQGGRIALVYGSTSNTFHTVSAGIAGPAPTDNIQFYYGADRNPLSYSAFGLTPTGLNVNCSITPSSPSCKSSAATTMAQAVTETPATTQTVETAATTQATTTVAQKAERLTPDQLKALIAGGAPLALPGAAQQTQTQVKQAAVADTTLSVQVAAVAVVAQSAPTQQAQSSGGAGQTFSAVADPVLRDPVAVASSSVAASSVQQTRAGALSAQQAVIVALSPPKPPKPAQETSGGNVQAAEQGGAMAALAVVPPGFTSYQAKQLADAVFYAPREIYKRRKPVDAYMTLYRLLQSGDRRWEAMTEAQYGKR